VTTFYNGQEKTVPTSNEKRSNILINTENKLYAFLSTKLKKTKFNKNPIKSFCVEVWPINNL
jgi:hypothetical protein